MKIYQRTKTLLALLLAGGWSTVTAQGLSFRQALDLAEQQSPALAANAAQIDAARSAAGAAGALPDPKLVAGIDNYPVTGSERGQLYVDPMTMQKVGVIQDVPNGTKRQAQEEVAQADVGLAAAQGEIIRVKVRQDTAIAWLQVYYLERKVQLFTDLDQENRLLNSAVKAQVASGHGAAADLMLPRMEAAALADRRDDLERDIRKARSDLKRDVGSIGEATLTGPPPTLSVDATHLLNHLHRHPDLLAFDAQTRKAESEVHEARAAKHSDWGVEMDYQHRPAQFGDMVSVQFVFALPVSARTRQDPIIAAKTSELTRIAQEREDMLREHSREIENLLADYDTLSRQVQRAREVVLPLIQEKMALLAADYRSGKSDLATLIAARREWLDQQIKLIDLEKARLNTAVGLDFSTGEIP